MGERIIKPGTKMSFGAPADPMPAIMSDAIGLVVAQVPGVREAYLPQFYVEGEGPPRQVLVVGVDDAAHIPEIMTDLMGKMALLLPPGQFIDILPYACASMPNGARVPECRILGSGEKPWWKFWSA